MNSISTLAIIKTNSQLSDLLPIELQVQVVNLPTISNVTTENESDNAFEALRSLISNGIAPFFEVLAHKTTSDNLNDNDLLKNHDDDKDTSRAVYDTTRKKITELALSFQHLQQKIVIPNLSVSVHPVIKSIVEKARSSGIDVSIDLLPKDLLTDTNFLNSLQSTVSTWIKSVQKVTKLSRDPSEGTATQEIVFWTSLETALLSLQEQLQGEEIQLTMDILKNAKRYHATIGFLSETGLKEAIETSQKYNQLMKDLPLDDLLSSINLPKLNESIIQIFLHMKKLRSTSYPINRALPFIERISDDFNSKVKSLINNLDILNLPYNKFELIIKEIESVFNTWDRQAKNFTNLARDVLRKRNEKFIFIKITSHHIKTKERLEYISNFRARHERLVKALKHVADSDIAETFKSSMPDDFDPINEMNIAYELVKAIDVTDTSEGKK